LPHDIPNIRILTYGYNSQLVGPNSTEFRMLDHRRHFVQELRNARSSIAKRPIIFLGHSLGGVLVLQVRLIFLDMIHQKLNRDLFDLTSAIFFFGTPHNGLQTAELEAMVDDMASKPESTASMLLQQLRQGSEFLESQADELVDIWPGRRIVSFYELLETPTVRRMVDSFSALLYLPNEYRIPVGQNHTDMVKFMSPTDETYRTVVTHMKETLEMIHQTHSKWVSIAQLSKEPAHADTTV
ncbi:hypothetical protein K440DRAFT_534211, partial [Wilcoxina mikolae CBS 423.85]